MKSVPLVASGTASRAALRIRSRFSSARRSHDGEAGTQAAGREEGGAGAETCGAGDLKWLVVKPPYVLSIRYLVFLRSMLEFLADVHAQWRREEEGRMTKPKRTCGERP